jgi:hypothetical protein
LFLLPVAEEDLIKHGVQSKPLPTVDGLRRE